MDKKEYEQSLIKADGYFSQDKYNLFLDEFAKCFAFDNDCFNDELNVFRFSLSNYSLTNNRTINEFNRFAPLLGKYLSTLPSRKGKDDFLSKVKGLIDKKYDEVGLYDNVIHYETFNFYCALLSQLHELAKKCLNESLTSSQELIDDLLNDIETKTLSLKKLVRWTRPSFKIHFIYLPKKPKEFLKEMEKNVIELRKRH